MSGSSALVAEVNADRRRAFSRVRPPGKSYLAFLRMYHFDASASQMSHFIGNVPGSKKAHLHSGRATAAGGSTHRSGGERDVWNLCSSRAEAWAQCPGRPVGGALTLPACSSSLTPDPCDCFSGAPFLIGQSCEAQGLRPIVPAHSLHQCH